MNPSREDRIEQCIELGRSLQSASNRLQTALDKQDWKTAGEIANTMTPDTERLTYSARIISTAVKQ